LVFLKIIKKEGICSKNTSKNMVETRKRPDYFLLLIIFLLIIVGFLILASVSFPLSQKNYGNNFYYLIHQILYGFLPGLILGLLAYKMSLNRLKKLAPFFLLINIFLMVLVFLPVIGLNFRGASRWIVIGNFTFQPSEILKLTFIIYLASWLASRTEKNSPAKNTNFGQTFLAFLIIVGIVSLLLILQPDITTLMIIISFSLLMYFLSETPLWYNILISLLIILALLVLIKIAPYRYDRIMIFLNPELDPMGKGFQSKQVIIAVGSGGIGGVGLGFSQQKFGSLPQSISDCIFSIFAEETGLIGSLVLISIFLLFFWRGFRVGSLNSHNRFYRLCAFGITSWIITQAFINIGSMIGILPLTGIPLPFTSYGGSHLITELIGMGLLLNISKEAKN